MARGDKDIATRGGFHTNPERINRNGRPKGSQERAVVARKWLAAKEGIQNPLSGAFEELTQEDIMTLRMIQKARKGDVQAYNALMDSAYGKPNKEIELSDPDGALAPKISIPAFRWLDPEEIIDITPEPTENGESTNPE